MAEIPNDPIRQERTKADADLQDQLFALSDAYYRHFQCHLMPTVEPDAVIGVRMPALRKLAKAYAKNPEVKTFLQILPHRYYEENNLHGLLICALQGYEETVAALESFLPHVNNWATCDLLTPKAFRARPAGLLHKIQVWMRSDHPYTIRFGIKMLMDLYLDDAFSPEYAQWVAAVRSDEYYVRMMVAWYFATALAKQYDAALPFLQNRQLELWTHNKAIQKVLESYRISDDRKAYLRTLKIKSTSF